MMKAISLWQPSRMPPGHELTDDFKCGNFAPGRYAWKRTDVEVSSSPIPYRGSQGFFEIPDSFVFDRAAATPAAQGRLL